ncbi:MAG: exodeoxyribonuclease VII large subunit [Erysipelotrichaceae bacterium]|nr:exodeoxyribonuclease VII large subunit [Erysipelotrichaceae bacterium]
MIEKEWTVSQLVNYLKSKLDADSFIQSIWVSGEISNFTAHSSGHFYFTLKDEFSRISCVMFASHASKLLKKPLDGQKVLLKSNTSIYEKSGQIQLYVLDIVDVGTGILYQKYLVLKEKLENEGLFSASHKQPLPKYPFTIAVVTGRDTAARQDVVTTLQRRWPVARIKEFNCLVQGQDAYLSIIEALRQADQSGSDIIILARGGGSIEDLWAFNEEALIRFIYSLKTPIITGVGHETDTTLVDFVSDQRAVTPTGAAELATFKLTDVQTGVAEAQQRIVNSVKRRLTDAESALLTARQRKVLLNPELIVQTAAMNLLMNIKTLEYNVIRQKQRGYQLDQLRNRISVIEQQRLNEIRKQISYAQQTLMPNMISLLKARKQDLAHHISLLKAYSPLHILEKGYAIPYHDQQMIKSIDDIEAEEELTIRMADGNLQTIVKTKEKFHDRTKL